MAFTSHHWNGLFPDYDVANVADGTDTDLVDVPHYMSTNFPDYAIEDVLDNPTE